ncbi:MAG: hypothetical protein ACR2NA_11190 [Solirubrobacterales bacterium]
MTGGRVAALLCATALVAVAGCGDSDEPAAVTDTVTVTAPTPDEGAAPAQTESGEATTGSGSAAAPDGSDATPRGCGTVAFEANSDAGAFEVQATGVGCDTAREVARGSRTGERSYERSGFRCASSTGEGQLPSHEYRCERGADLVTFTAG